MPCHKRKPSSRRSRKGFTMLFVVLGASLSMLVLYFLWSVMMPIVGTIDNTMYSTVMGMNLTESWISDYTNRGVWLIHDSFTLFMWGCVIAIVATVIIFAVRRQPNEQTYYN